MESFLWGFAQTTSLVVSVQTDNVNIYYQFEKMEALSFCLQLTKSIYKRGYTFL